MNPMRNSRTIRILVIVFFSFVMFACSDGGNDSPPTNPNSFTSLWNNSLQYCGINCHTPDSTGDFTNLGPALSTKANFYNNLIEKSVTVDYPQWAFNKGGDCNSVYFITPGNANESTMAAALILSVSDTLGGAHNCTTSYNGHEQLNQTISDSKLANALITWINEGAQNN